MFNLQEVPQPELTSKPETQWTEEERKSLKEYEKKANELREEQEKYKKVCGVSHKTLKKSLPKKDNSVKILSWASVLNMLEKMLWKFKYY